MKLSVGMYARTDLGEIGRITSIVRDNVFSDNEMIFYNSKPFLKGKGVKASHNIIDILELGDYVNGLRIEKNKYGELYTSYVYYGGDIEKQCEVYTIWLKEYKEDMIYSIVTHEQMKQMEYKVGE